MSLDPKQATASAARRDFMGGLLQVAAVVACGSASLPAFAFAASGRQRGDAVIDVRAHGARGDGIHDDTSSFQAAINALPESGGTVTVPAGAYLIDPLRSVKLRSRMHLSLATGARLLARANAAPRAYVLLAQQVEEVEISGGRILGERDSHLAASGEWGHGIRIRGCARVTVRDIHVSRCWGDGISAGGIVFKTRASQPGIDYVFENVVCTGNRRQGLTIGSSRRVRIRNCAFTDTGGTPPGAGIDVEPDTGVASDIVIEDCLLRGNRGPGISIYKRASGITVRRCTIDRNRGDGILAVNAVDCVFADNIIRGNGLKGISLKAGSRNVRIAGNRFGANGRGGKGKGKDQVRVADDSRAIRVEADNIFE